MAEYVAIEMHNAALPVRVGKHLHSSLYKIRFRIQKPVQRLLNARSDTIIRLSTSVGTIFGRCGEYRWLRMSAARVDIAAVIGQRWPPDQ